MWLKINECFLNQKKIIKYTGIINESNKQTYQYAWNLDEI